MPGAWASQQQEGSGWGVGEVRVLLAGSMVQCGLVWRLGGGKERERGAKQEQGHSQENEKVIQSTHDRMECV